MDQSFCEWLQWNEYDLLKLSSCELSNLWDQYYAEQEELKEKYYN